MTLKDKNLYYVGGVVRDEILGTASFDTDFCYEGDAIEFAKKQGLNIVKENPDFGTVRITPPQPSPAREGAIKLELVAEIDIASTREETYPSAGHLPVVKNIGCSLKNDLKRRDFTINAMAKNTLTGEIVDYFGGMEDIRNKKLRVLHPQSFIDDPTRIVRGLKFAVRFGFELDEDTKKLQDEYLANINYDMSYHRLKKELKETFNLNREEAYERFVEQGIYKLLGTMKTPHPQPLTSQKMLNGSHFLRQNHKGRGEHAELVSKYAPKYPWLVYLGLFDLSNLELTVEERAIVDSVPQTIPKTDFETYKMFNNLPLESILIYALSVDFKSAINYLDNLKDIKLDITGEDLKSLRIPQGKVYKEIFDYALQEKFNDPKITKVELLNHIRSQYGSV